MTTIFYGKPITVYSGEMRQAQLIRAISISPLALQRCRSLSSVLADLEDQIPKLSLPHDAYGKTMVMDGAELRVRLMSNEDDSGKSLDIITKSEAEIIKTYLYTGLKIFGSPVEKPLVEAIWRAVSNEEPEFVKITRENGIFLQKRPDGSGFLITIRVYGNFTSLENNHDNPVEGKRLDYDPNDKTAQDALDLVIFTDSKGEIELLPGYLLPLVNLPPTANPCSKDFADLNNLFTVLWREITNDAPRFCFYQFTFDETGGRYDDQYKFCGVKVEHKINKNKAINAFAHELRHFLQDRHNLQKGGRELRSFAETDDRANYLLRESDIKDQLSVREIEEIETKVRGCYRKEKHPREVDAHYISALVMKAINQGLSIKEAFQIVRRGIRD